MTATAHSLVGVSLGKLVPNPYLALGLVFASNFILDAVPHWDVGTGWHRRTKVLTFIYSFLDVALGLGLAFFFFSGQLAPVYILLLVLTSTLADYLESPYIFLGWNFPPFIWFYKIQSRLHSRDGTLWGIMTQVIVVLPLVFLASR